VSIEGDLTIELLYRDQRVRRVGIHSSRPLQLPTLFEGKRVEEALHTIPLLYSLCSTAQASAAAGACRQAMAITSDPLVVRAENLLVTLETAREHLLRILMDWSAFLGETADRRHLLAATRLLPAAKGACFQQGESFCLKPVLQLDREALAEVLQSLAETTREAVYGMPAATWYALDDQADLDQWMSRGDTASARLLWKLRDDQLGQLGDADVHSLPAVEPQVMTQRLQQTDADRFVALPEWGAQPCETTPLTRQIDHPLIQSLLPCYGAGLLTRMVARLLELASLPARLQQLLHELMGGQAAETDAPIDDHGDGESGLGMVEAARGRLIHRVAQADGIIRRYQILAPTEWNFHPEGVVARGLLGLVADNDHLLKHYAGLFINAVDPCVGYRLEVV